MVPLLCAPSPSPALYSFLVRGLTPSCSASSLFRPIVLFPLCFLTPLQRPPYNRPPLSNRPRLHAVFPIVLIIVPGATPQRLPLVTVTASPSPSTSMSPPHLNRRLDFLNKQQDNAYTRHHPQHCKHHDHCQTSQQRHDCHSHQHQCNQH